MITVQVTKKFDTPDLCLPKLKKLVRAVCTRFKLHKALVSIAIVGDNEIRKLNKKFLNHSCSTDCLSFDLSEDESDSPKLFELVVNAEKAGREANLRNHSSQAELALYITHGLLHNFGFDDSHRDQAAKMHALEDRILQEIGFGLVYNKSAKKL